MKNILKRLTFKRSDLGEGISYDGTEQTLTWVDIPNIKVLNGPVFSRDGSTVILLIHQKGLFIKLNLIYRKKISKI